MVRNMNDRVDESPLPDLSHDFSAAASELRMATFRLARRPGRSGPSTP